MIICIDLINVVSMIGRICDVLLCKLLEKSIDRGKRRQPEWCEDNVEKLTLLIDA